MSDYTPIEQKVRVHNIYCQAQGPRVAKLEDDHLKLLILNNYEEVGEPDEYGGCLLLTTCGGANDALHVPPGVTIVCKVCGAPLRQFEVRWQDPS